MSGSDARGSGPLAGIRIVEFAGIGPAPMCAMLLADLGATVLRINRTESVDLGTKRPLAFDVLQRNRESIAVDLENQSSVDAALEIIAEADALIEGFRPGVMERLGLGPDVCLERNPRLVYGRMTGWGQSGPLAQAAGHDLNYIAITGALDAIGRTGGAPVVPLNLVGDFGGGALYLAVGLLAALHSAKATGAGQVVDAAIIDGTLSLMGVFYGSLAAGLWNLERGSNSIDSGAPFYDTYECADGKRISIAPLELRFFDELLRRLGIEEGEFADRLDHCTWPSLRSKLTAIFRRKTRAQWCELLEGTDACFAPVLSMAEAALHPQIIHREGLLEIDGVLQPAPAPRFSKTKCEKPRSPKTSSQDDAMASLRDWFGADRYRDLDARGVLAPIRGTA
jgi:alpha-methylacyl-CoA racemase